MKLKHIKSIAMLGTTLVALVSFTVAAQPVAKPGPGMGPGAQADLGLERRIGMKMRFNKGNTLGWSLMSSEERTAHREKMLAAKTYEECKTIQSEHHQAMEGRAKEKGLSLPAPGKNACDRIQALGKFK